MKFRKHLVLTLVPVMLIASMAAPALAAAPTNDERSGTTVIPDLPFTDRIDATDATNSADDPVEERDDYQYPICWSGPTVWYSFTANKDVRLVANTFDSDYDTVLAVFNGEPSEDSLLVCNDDTRGNQSCAAFEAKSGRTYTFVVSGNSPGLLAFNLRAAIPPRNDNFPDARKVGIELPFRHSVDTSDATLNVNDPSCSGRARSVWYRYTRPQQWDTRRIAISTRGSDYPTSLSVYTGSRQNLKQLECDAGGVNSRVRLPAEPGETYWIMVAACEQQPGRRPRAPGRRTCLGRSRWTSRSPTPARSVRSPEPRTSEAPSTAARRPKPRFRCLSVRRNPTGRSNLLQRASRCRAATSASGR